MRISAEELLSDLDRGISLPASWYADPAIHDLEIERIFRRSWQYLGRVEQLARAGDYVARTIAQVPVVVVRHNDGLAGFVNVCRHRRHEVVTGCGNARVLQCPYHAWTYDLDGQLRAAPRSERDPDFRKEDYPLLPVRVEVWGPWVFVNLDPSAAALAEYLGELPAILRQSGLELEQLRFHRSYDWERDANWKVMIENYLECYHCPVQHPGFSAVIDVDQDAYSLKAHAWHSSQVAPVRSSALEGTGKKTMYDARGAVAQAQYHFLWPNFTINVNPGQPNLSIDHWLPAGPGRTRGHSEYWFGPEVTADYARDLMAFSEQVGKEDDALTSSVQRGVNGGLPARGRFLLNCEHLVVHFQKLVVRGLCG